MAGLRVSAHVGAVSVTAGTPKTILHLRTPANQGALVKSVVVTQEQATGAAPTNETALVEILHQDATGTLITTNVTIEKIDQDRAETVQCTVSICTAEPTTSKIVNQESINPAMGGAFAWQALRESDMIPVKGGSAIGIRISPAYPSGARNFRAELIFDE